MKKSLINELIDKTGECLARYWQHDFQYALDLCSDNIVWIGATADQFMQGIEAVTSDFQRIDRELKSCHLSNQTFLVAGQDAKSCSICGKYLVTTDEDEDVFLQVEQRCTFQWKIIGDEPRIECIHISNPMGELRLNEGERFPNWLGKQSLKYLKRTISLSKEQKRFALIDKDGTTHFIKENEIVYVQADDHGIILHTIEGTSRYAIQFSAFMQSQGENLLEVRRSYAVNPIYVKEIKNRELQMQTGAVILLPEKRVAEIRQLLKKYTDK